ncbi:MAG: transposase family protein [Alphaproteobacteria bacterium]|nr:transposase family protein [Alphaproteobacteria bacterium]
MKLSETARADGARELARTPRGERTAAVRRLAGLYGCSPSTVWKAAGAGGPKRRREPLRPEYRQWAETAAVIASRSPDPKRPDGVADRRLPLDLAIDAGIQSGELPPEAASMPLGTAHRIVRELGLDERPGRTTGPMRADWPMQALQVDGSTSHYLVVDEALPDGDFVLKAHHRPYGSGGYKNKPVAADRLRLLSVGVWDMCTGCVRARYVVGRGESAPVVLKALCEVLRPTGDPERPLHGVPTDLWSDQGPLFKSRAGRDLVERLDMTLVTGAPYQKTRMGGIERSWRTLWGRFERSLVLPGFVSILLSELNARYDEHERRENRRAARVRVDGRRVSRAVAFTALARRRPEPIREMPENAFETMAQERDRAWVDASGIVRWDGEFEVKGWHSRHVTARRAMDGSGGLVLTDLATGERRQALPYRPRPYGEVRAAPRTPAERAARRVSATGADPYAARRPAASVPLPARSAPPAELENPLDASPPPLAKGEGIRILQQAYGLPIPEAARVQAERLIEEEGLDREGILRLAQDWLALGAASG